MRFEDDLEIKSIVRQGMSVEDEKRRVVLSGADTNSARIYARHLSTPAVFKSSMVKQALQPHRYLSYLARPRGPRQRLPDTLGAPRKMRDIGSSSIETTKKSRPL